jgi:hypothetical protein
VNPDEEKGSPKRKTQASEPFDMSKPPKLESPDRSAWNLWHTEQLIERESQRYMREGFCTDIEEARRDAREAMWPFA